MTYTFGRPQLYFAAPLFSAAERAFNARLERLLDPYFRVYLPQRDGGLVADMASHMSADEAKRRVFSMDVHAIEACDVLLAVLDGRSIDEGVCWELGYAWGLGKSCFGLQTDPRRLLPHGNNPMIDGGLITIFHSEAALLDWAKVHAKNHGGG